MLVHPPFMPVTVALAIVDKSGKNSAARRLHGHSITRSYHYQAILYSGETVSKLLVPQA